MLTHLELINFTAFTDLKIDFSPNINVIIGENNTGKTHLLKAAYLLSNAASLLKNNSHISDKELTFILTPRLLRLFLPLNGKLDEIRHRNGNEKS